MTVSVRSLERGDRARWQELYAGYGEFYNKPLGEEKADRVWAWLMDPHAFSATDAASTAQRVYDKLATRTQWVTYDMEV